MEIAPGDAEDNVDSHELQLLRKLEHPHICAALASKTRIVVEPGQVLLPACMRQECCLVADGISMLPAP